MTEYNDPFDKYIDMARKMVEEDKGKKLPPALQKIMGNFENYEYSIFKDLEASIKANENTRIGNTEMKYLGSLKPKNGNGLED